MPWLQPYPDRLLDEIAPRSGEPDAVVVRRESIELAFLATIQLLPAQQRVVLIMRDVVGWSAAEAAEILDTTVPAINSALQRARATLRDKSPVGRRDTGADLSVQERDLLQRYVAVHERPDPVSMAALARHDIRVTMPPQPLCFDGWESLAPLREMAFGPDGFGEWRLVPTRANRMPAAACYLRERGDTVFRAYKLDVIRVKDGLIAEITSFEPHLFTAFGLAATL